MLLLGKCQHLINKVLSLRIPLYAANASFFLVLSVFPALLLLLSLLGIAVVGSFGAELSANLSRPFFVLVKNMVFFRTVERVDALVVMLWIFPDFLLTSLFLWAGQYSIRLLLGLDAGYNGSALDFSNGRFVIWLSAAAVTLFALFLAPDAMSLELWSAYIIPALNLSFAFLFFPLIYIIGKEKGRI